MNTAEMTSRSGRAWRLGLLLLAMAAISFFLRPGSDPVNAAESARRIDLDRLIPAEFAGWQLEAASNLQPLIPDLEAKVEAAYGSTLGRTYINQERQRVMLSIAYGNNQLTERVQAHRPEYCYRAQGFTLSAATDGRLATVAGTLPIRRLHAASPGRSEPITYWLTIGDQAVLPGLKRKLAQLRYGLSGEIPDGLLVRVSSIDRDDAAAYALHDRFIQSWLAAVDGDVRTQLAGLPSPDL